MTRLFAFLLFVAIALPVTAGEAQWDPRLTRGTLDNGLNYILHDSGKPEDPFNIRLVVHAGSVDEDRPSGAAHMLEHMVFQSNRAHPQSIHRYIQEIGWRQGVQVNAVTRETETQYMIRTRPDDALDLSQSLALAADLAFGAELRAEDWAKERFVILEELRQGDSAADRISRQKKAVLRVGSRYVDRPTIGTREGIEAASIEDIRAFYEQFYTASNMTLIVSGRIDRVSAEAAIRRLFGNAPKKPKPARPYVELPLKESLTAGLVQDPAGSSSQTTYAFRMAMPERSSEEGQFAYLQKYLLTRLIRDAIQAQSPHYADTVKSLGFVAQETTERRLILAFNASGQDHDVALSILLEAVERLRREGISQKAFDAAMASARRVNEANIEAASQRTYAEWEDRITSAVLMGSVLDDPARRAERTKELLASITFEGLQARMREMLAAPDQVVFYQLPGGKTRSAPMAAEIEAMRDELSARAVLAQLPALKTSAKDETATVPQWPADVQVARTGTIVSQEHRTSPEVREWTLSNGDRVVWLVRDTPDAKTYLSGQSAVGFMNAEYGSATSQIALQLWTQSGYRFWTQDQYDVWNSAQSNGGHWSYALKAGMLDVAIAAKPANLPEMLERYARDVAFGTVREEAVNAVEEDRVSLDGRDDSYSRLLYGKDEVEGAASSTPSVSAEHFEAAARALLSQRVTWFAVGPAPDAAIRDAFAGVIGAVPRGVALTPEPLLQAEGVRIAESEGAGKDRARVQLSFFTPMNWTPEASFLVSALTPVAQQALKNELRYRLAGIYTLQFELELDTDSNRAIGSLSFYCAPERAKELAEAALAVLRNMPEYARQTDTARIRSDIEFAESGRLSDPNTWLRRLALSYKRYGDAGYLTRMGGLADSLTDQMLQENAAAVFRTDNVAILTQAPRQPL
ncbi:pitrilysin family protein [Neorhizobium sp. JUb45]|uniref:M16 family metallopeptidase n=1 Tax=unclassified Neorhizobium TaxID=2629175 RepID=UPI0014050DCE|nr:pitrilysin family protein [Neorhizobium sp. JUb45]